MSRPINITFRCDASFEIGTGHFRRCLLLAMAFLAKGHECSFVTNVDSLKFFDDPRIKNFEIINDVNSLPSKADLLITDHYFLPGEYYSAVSESQIPHMIIDDICDQDFYLCDYLLISNFAYTQGDYKDKVSNHCHIFDGIDALLLDKKFTEIAQSVNKRARPPQNFLLFLGGTDPYQLTLRFLKIIESCNIKIPNLVVVIGKANKQSESIQTICENLGAELHIETDNMAQLIKMADISIGIGGTTMWEKLALKLPSVEYSHSICQEETFRKLHQKQYIQYAGDVLKAQDEEIEMLLRNILANGLDILYCHFENDHLGKLVDDLRALLNKKRT